MGKGFAGVGNPPAQEFRAFLEGGGAFLKLSSLRLRLRKLNEKTQKHVESEIHDKDLIRTTPESHGITSSGGL